MSGLGIPFLRLRNWNGYGYEAGYEYQIYESKINHLFYMDELNLHGKNDEELEGLLSAVKKFSDDIGLEFGSDKCAKATFIRGRIISTSKTKLDKSTIIRELDQEETYKHLGIDEGDADFYIFCIPKEKQFS